MTEERKVVTVLFADCVGSTPMGERMDPEDLAEVMHSFFAEMKAAVEAEGGVVEKFIGDAVMAVFGVPTSHEDDPSRALRCALSMSQRLAGLNARLDATHGVGLAVRIGVNSGEVLVSMSPGEDLGRITGDAVNVAARLEQAAEPGEVVVAERTARAAPGFQFAELGPLALKGKSVPVQAVRLTGAGPTASPGAAPRGLAGLHAPMVGREHELALVQAAFERSARDERPHLVTVYGEAGVGKSRLVGELLSWARALEQPPTVLRGRCLPYGDGVTYWPMAEILKQLAGVLDSDPAGEATARLRRLADSFGDSLSDDDVAALAVTAGFDDSASPLAEATPKQRRAAMHGAWRTLLSCLARSAPVIAVVEDIHWADEALLDMLEDVADRCEGAIVVICPSRPDLNARRPGWGGGRRNASSVSLEPLTLDEARRLTALLLDVDDLPESVRARILERAEGNPFFLEEILRKLIDEGRIVRDGTRWRATAEAAEVTIPDSVQSVLSARIDLLPSHAKHVLQRASVVGRVFWTGSISRVGEPASDELDDVLDVLEARDLISTRIGSAFRGERECTFRHILTRNVAYDSIPRRERGSLHAEVGAWLAEVASGREGEFAELLAHHWSQAHAGVAADTRSDPAEVERRRRLAHQWNLAASAEALRRAVVPRAVALADQALTLASTFEERAAAAKALGDAHGLAGDGSPAMAAFRIAADALIAAGAPDRHRAALLCARLVEYPSRFPGSLHEPFDEAELYAYLDRGVELAGDGDSEAMARLLVARSFWARPGTGEGDPSVQARHRIDAEAAVDMARRLGLTDVESGALDALSSDLSATGELRRAADNVKRRLELLPRLRDPLERGDSLCMAAWASFDLGEYAVALEHARHVSDEVERTDWAVMLHAYAWQASTNLVLGDWDAVLDAWAAASASLEPAGLTVPPPFTAPTWGSASYVLEARGRCAEAKEAAAAALDLPSRVAALCVRTPAKSLWLARLGHIADMGDGLATGEQALNRPLRALAAIAHLEAGQRLHDWGSRQADILRLVTCLDDEPPPPNRACLAELRGRMALDRGDPAAGIAELERARDLWASTGARWLVARMSLALAEAGHVHAHARTTEWASDALAEFERLGALDEIARARALSADRH